jgi:oligosaccharide repeat unit polymerase
MNRLNQLYHKNINFLIFISPLIIIFFVLSWSRLADNTFGVIKAILFFLLAILSFLYSYIKNKDPFHPTGIYNSVWFLILAIAELQLSTLQEPMLLETYCGVLGALVSFNLGGTVFFKQKIFKYEIEKINYRRLKKILLVTYPIMLFAFIYEINKIGFIPLFMTTGELKFINYLHYLTVGAIIPIYLGYAYISNKGKFKLFDFVVLLIILLCIIQLLLLRTRQILLFPILGILLYMNKTMKLKLRYFYIIAIFYILIFISLGNLRLAGSAQGYSSDISGYGLIQKTDSQFLGWFNTYTVMGVQNFQNNIKYRTEFYHGLNTFYFLADLTLLDRVLKFDEKRQIIYSGLGGNIDLSTYLGDLYQDFGLLWVIIIPFFYGMFCVYVYNFYRTSRNYIVPFIYGIVLSMIVLSTFSSYFSRSIPFVFMGMTIFLGHVLYRLSLNTKNIKSMD